MKKSLAIATIMLLLAAATTAQAGHYPPVVGFLNALSHMHRQNCTHRERGEEVCEIVFDQKQDVYYLVVWNPDQSAIREVWQRKAGGVSIRIYRPGET